ncbi:spore germination protein [Selenihalanaerobacter shriftii]|uniref:Spore germination protein KA n=1 Tax=Selenihalanaerobacter shriftii TaxID=142842 RepID=A0A1T4PIA8_9FIRM|nr:spore germination protein [Selenihalanaerobacter shriftii]SJZ91057.1 spore germination protein KA [Selenihalanaerobacter shriftii]
MFNRIFKMLNYLKLKSSNQKAKKGKKNIEKIPRSIQDIKERLKELFEDSSDFVMREVVLGNESNIEVIIAHIDGLTDRKSVNNNIVKPLILESRDTELDKDLNQSNIIEILKDNILSASELSEVKDFQKSLHAMLSGDTIIYIDGTEIALKVGMREWESRGVTEPDTESVVRGPREGFTETLRTNTTLLRRKIKNSNLKFENITLGEKTNTDVAICYVKGLANEDILKTVRRRVKKIKIDSILESGYIEEFIEDAPLSIFPTVGNSEKPDIVAAKILEGRVAILCDGTPFVLTVPHLFIESIQSSEDYYARPYFSSLLRILRGLALFITTIFPAFYVALVTFHQTVIPFKLLLTVAASRDGIPFSAFTETLMMGLTFELLREAGVRMPRPIGQAVSIVGALVLGQAAVEAGVASNPVIMVTALTAISSFILPALGGVIPLIRIIMLITANIIGLLGISLTGVVILIHLCTLRSFGVPYLVPFAPLAGMELKDTFIRLPLWLMWRRPHDLIEDDREAAYRMNVDIKTKED